MKALLGTKIGMTQLFGEDGVVTRVTVIQAGPCVVTQKKTPAVDGYSATQIAFGEVKPKKLNKPELGHLKKSGASPVVTLLRCVASTNRLWATRSRWMPSSPATWSRSRASARARASRVS